MNGLLHIRNLSNPDISEDYCLCLRSCAQSATKTHARDQRRWNHANVWSVFLMSRRRDTLKIDVAYTVACSSARNKQIRLFSLSAFEACLHRVLYPLFVFLAATLHVDRHNQTHSTSLVLIFTYTCSYMSTHKVWEQMLLRSKTRILSKTSESSDLAAWKHSELHILSQKCHYRYLVQIHHISMLHKA